MNWHPDHAGIGKYPGDTLGDNQTGDEWTVRLIRDDAPGVIDVTFAVTFNESNGRYAPEGVLAFSIGEQWSDLLPDDSHPYDYETAAEADPWAERAVKDYAANADKYLDWDGRKQEIR